MKRFSIFIACALASVAVLAEDGVTPTTIKIGVMGPFTGNASSYSKAEIGLDAYYKWVNDQGGINCHKVEVTIKPEYAIGTVRTKPVPAAAPSPIPARTWVPGHLVGVDFRDIHGRRGPPHCS